ncbi:MAG: hypothetical protein ACYTEW_26865 [Planctomycetota bacterium]|jgi:hypothetical protein
MAQVHSINANTINYIGVADWQDKATAAYLTGQNAVSRYRRHIWQSNVMPASEWNTIEALEGQQVTLVTTDYTDRNAANYVTYYNAMFTALTGKHEGPNMHNVRFEFLVKL